MAVPKRKKHKKFTNLKLKNKFIARSLYETLFVRPLYQKKNKSI